MKLTTTKSAVIHTATKQETVTLRMWNKSGAIVPGLNVKNNEEDFNKNDVMDVGSPNSDPDTVHVIELAADESVKAWCGVEDAVEFEIVTN